MTETLGSVRSAGAQCYRLAHEALTGWEEAWAEYVTAKGLLTRKYAESFDGYRSLNMAVGQCEVKADADCWPYEEVMLLAEGKWRIAKAAYELNKAGMNMAQSNMASIKAEMELAR